MSNREESLLADVRRWRRIALTAIAIALIGMAATVWLLLRPGHGAPAPGAEGTLRRAAEVLRTGAHSREVTATVATLRVSFSRARLALLDVLFFGEDPSERARLEAALTQVQADAERLRTLVDDPQEQALVKVVEDKLSRWSEEVRRLRAGEAVEMREQRARASQLRGVSADIDQALNELADAADARRRELDAKLESLLRP